jgi:hypothetical protein
MPNYGDYNSTPVLYLLSNLVSDFYVQKLVGNGDNKDNSVMSNISIFMRITNSFLLNLPIIHASCDYTKVSYVHNLTSEGFIQ